MSTWHAIDAATVLRQKSKSSSDLAGVKVVVALQAAD